MPGPGGPGPALAASWWGSGLGPRPSGAGPGCGGWSPPWAAAAPGLPLAAPLCLRGGLLSVGGAAAAAGVGPGPLPAQTVGHSAALRGAAGCPKLAGCRPGAHAPPARVVPARGVAAGGPCPSGQRPAGQKVPFTPSVRLRRTAPSSRGSCDGAPRSSRPTKEVVPWPPANPRRDTHRPGGGGTEPLLFPVPPAQAVTAGAGPQWGRKDGSRRRTPHSAPTLKSPFFFGFQKPFLFPAGKKKWVLSSSQRARRVVAPHTKKSHAHPRHSEAVRPKNPYSRPFSLQLRKRTGDADSSLRSE